MYCCTVFAVSLKYALQLLINMIAVYLSCNLWNIILTFPYKYHRVSSIVSPVQKCIMCYNLYSSQCFLNSAVHSIFEFFQDLLNRTRTGEPLYWYRNLNDYYYRPQWQLFDIRYDPEELTNLAYNSNYSVCTFKKLILFRFIIYFLTVQIWI